MSIGTILYTLLIRPLELLYEIIFSVSNIFIGNAGLCIIVLSLTVNILVLPLYKRADELQAEEREKQKKLEKWTKHIKKTFKGDERFLMLQTYYRQNDYKPVYSLKGSLSLILQVPFFIAAYRFLSGLESIRGLSFGPIHDLGNQDALFMIGDFPINILPILMTLINIMSGYVYTKGQPLKTKLQLYGVALVFLVLLYHSPSGLVFYWLLNNIFSLIKNLIIKLKESSVLASRIPLSLRFSKPVVLMRATNNTWQGTRLQTLLFFTGGTFLSVFLGLFIPSNVIKSSVAEFMDVSSFHNPARYLAYSFLLAIGYFIIWAGVFYFLSSKKVQSLFCEGIWIACGISFIDYMCFGTNLGVLSSFLKYEKTPVFSIGEKIANLLIIFLIAGLIYILFMKKINIIEPVAIAGLLSILALCIINTASITQNYRKLIKIGTNISDTASIPLSKKGKNVIVFMLDRAMGTQVPYIMNEKPELKEKFDGFTYYPNTVSFGAYTNFGTPALFGGYEYTPENMNKRNKEELKDKHDEALKVMPVLFNNLGYNVTVCDPPYAGYEWIPDLSIYNDYPDIHTYLTDKQFNDVSEQVHQRTLYIRKRNFFCLSVVRCAPLILQGALYNNGLYHETPRHVDENHADNAEIAEKNVEDGVQTMEGISKASGIDQLFINAYSVLEELPNITQPIEGNNNTFMMIANNTTHEPCLLQKPDYKPSAVIDNTEYDNNLIAQYTLDGKTMRMENDIQVIHYHANMAAFIKLGEWFDYLRETDVYDNTRIILISDHGRDLGQFDLILNDKYDLEFLMPLLMVKDFNDEGYHISNQFMTQADVPALAMRNLIPNMVNPFTNHKIIMPEEKDNSQSILFSYIHNIKENNGNTFLPGDWLSVHDNIYDINNWKYMGTH